VIDPLLQARRSLIRLGVVALLLIAGAAMLARSTSRRVAARTPPLTAESYAATARAEAEALLESHPAVRGAGAPVLCATSFVGAGEAAGARSRVFVQALCRELCLVGSEVRQGMGTSTPAAIVVVTGESRWHPVGAEVPTLAHYVTDVRAIFPVPVRQKLTDRDTRRLMEARLDERVRERWPGARWAGDLAPSGCEAATAGR